MFAFVFTDIAGYDRLTSPYDGYGVSNTVVVQKVTDFVDEYSEYSVGGVVLFSYKCF